MANRHLGVGYEHNYKCHRRKQVCSLDNKACRRECYRKRNPEEYPQNGAESTDQAPPIYDNMDVINDAYGNNMNPKLKTADERLAAQSVRSGKKNQRAIEGAVRATREQFQCHFTQELEDHYQRRWWDHYEYPMNEDNWWNQLEYYDTTPNGDGY